MRWSFPVFQLTSIRKSMDLASFLVLPGLYSGRNHSCMWVTSNQRLSSAFDLLGFYKGSGQCGVSIDRDRNGFTWMADSQCTLTRPEYNTHAAAQCNYITTTRTQYPITIHYSQSQLSWFPIRLLSHIQTTVSDVCLQVLNSITINKGLQDQPQRS